MKANNLEEKLFEALLKVAIEEAFRQEMEEMPSCEELNALYKPSPDLDKKIRKIIARHEFKIKISIWKKRFGFLLLTLILLL